MNGKLPNITDLKYLKSKTSINFNDKAKLNLKRSTSVPRKVNFDPNVKEITITRTHSAASKSPSLEANEANQSGKTDEELALLAHQYLKSPPPNPSSKPPHWLTYYQEDTPKYIIEAKKRLFQVKPSTPPMTEAQKHAEHAKVCSNNPYNNENTKSNPNVLKHFLTYDAPETPENIRDIRIRYGDERYKKNANKGNRKLVYSSLKPDELNKYISKTCVPANAIPLPNFQENSVQEIQRPKTTSVIIRNHPSQQEEQHQILLQKPPIPTKTIIYNHYSVPAKQNLEQPKYYTLNGSSQLYKNEEPEYLAAMANYFDTNNLLSDSSIPQMQINDYNNQLMQNEAESKQHEQELYELSRSEITPEANDWINQEWDRYYGFANQSKVNNEQVNKISQSPMSMNKENDILNNYLVRPATSIGIQNTTRKVHSSLEEKRTPIPFENWIQNANEKEKNAVLNMLKTIDGSGGRVKSAKADDKPKKNPIMPTYGVKTRPPSRKLGKTRQLHKFPCDVCEKLLVKQQLWDMNKTVCVHGGVHT